MHSRKTRRLGTEPLENRWLPSGSPIGPLLRPYSFTEVMVSVRSATPIQSLNQWIADRHDPALAINCADSNAILRNGDASLVELKLGAGADPLDVVDQLRACPEVEWAEPNYIAVGDPRDFVPNDPSYPSQYQFAIMKLNNAWDIQTGNPSIIVAVTDDGIALDHPELAANIWTNSKEIAGNNVDDDSNGYVDDLHGWDFSSGDSNPNPIFDWTHGTHVAGIIAARTNNLVGVAGVAGGGPNGDGIRLIPIRWYGSNAWTSSMVAQSYAYAADNGAKIINTSYNFDRFVTDGIPNPVVASAMDYVYNKGVLIFQSAGNDNLADPARKAFDQSLFVASTDAGDARSSFSNYGKFVDIAAPGSLILSTMSLSGGTGFTYGTLSGTSMATPNAAAVAALIWSQHPNWTRDQVAAQLLGTADNVDAQNPGMAGQLGAGRANASRAVTQALASPQIFASTSWPAEGGSATQLPTNFTLSAPMRFDPASVTISRFDLRGDGLDNLFDTADDLVIPLTLNDGVAYRIGVGQLSLTHNVAAPVDRYRFRASATLTDPFGQPLDGNGDGIGGDDFTRTFFVNRQIDGFVYEDRDANGSRGTSEPRLHARAVYLDLNNNGTLDATTFNFAAAEAPISILDRQTVNSNLFMAGFNGIVSDVNVKLNVTHSYDSDLIAYLTGPTGVKVELIHRVGSSGNNFTSTVFDDQAGVTIADGAAPFTGSFRPSGLLASFNGLNANGTWTLQITDMEAPDPGQLLSWSLEITTSEPMCYTDLNGMYAFSGLANGTYVMRHAMPADWKPGPQPLTGAHVVTIAGAYLPVYSRDFSELRRDAIYGRFYDDVNLSGSFDATESVLPGWTAYIDANDNNLLDATETSAISEADGTFVFAKLSPGTHLVKRVVANGYTATQPASGQFSVTLTAGQTTTNCDFGQTTTPTSPPRVVQLIVDDGSPQRSLVRSLTIAFDQVVLFTKFTNHAFTLIGPNGPVFYAVDLSNSTATSTIARLTFNGSLTDGDYTLSVIADQIHNAAGQSFDGDGNGIGGDNFIASLHRFFGDVDGNRVVDAGDFAALRSSYGAGPSLFDFQGDGQTEASDFAEFRKRFGVMLLP